MEHPSNPAGRNAHWAWIVVGLLAVGALGAWMHLVGAGLWGDRPEPPQDNWPGAVDGEQPPPGAETPPPPPRTESPDAGGAAPEPPPASRPADAQPPATQAASQPAKPWQHPRFKARADDRARMARVISGLYRLNDKAVLKAMQDVPRHEFVPEGLSDMAYADRPLPIGFGQTISQPYIVAEMTRQLNLKGDSRVLEIGTGSGYQAAVLTEFTPHVYTIEIVKPLADSAAKRLQGLGYEVVKVRNADGYFGWSDAGPFDAIIVTCAAGQIPPPLLKQLAPGGRMVIPVGSPFATQSLMLVEKRKDGTVRSRSLMAVQFVPFIRKDTSSK